MERTHLLQTLHTALRRTARGLLQELLPAVCLLCAEPAADHGLCPACCLAFPWQGPACTRCALPLQDETAGLCGTCRVSPPLLDRCWASMVYAGPAATLLRRYKFHQDLAAGRSLARLMQIAAPPWPVPWAVAVPLHSSRLRRRGYDQADQLLRELRLPRWDGLRRVRATPPQSERGAQARQHNLEGAFALTAMPPATVVLVDDVMTTGSTLHACAAVLRQGGCRQVQAWVCARVP